MQKFYGNFANVTALLYGEKLLEFIRFQDHQRGNSPFVFSQNKNKKQSKLQLKSKRMAITATICHIAAHDKYI